MIYENVDMELKTKHGIDKLDLMVEMMPIITPETTKKLGNKYNRFKSWLCQKIKRGIDRQEELDLLEGIVKYVQSESASNERLESMDYLFGLKFLKQ